MVAARPTTLVVVLLGAASLALGGCRSPGRESLTQNMVNSRQWAMRGQDALQGERWNEAAQYFDQAVKTCPENERARAGIAETMWQQGDHAGAIREMQEAVRLSGDDAQLLVRLGEMQLATGDADGAQACANTAILAQWQNAKVWALQGDIARYRRQNEEALRCYHRALACDARLPHVQLAIAQIYAADERPLRALATLDTLIDQYPLGQAPIDVVFQRGRALQMLGRYDDASECLAAAWQRAPDDVRVAKVLAECQSLGGNPALARLTIQTALNRHPADRELLSYAAQLSSDQRMAARDDRR